MRFIARFRPSPALVVASIALLASLAGTGVAAVTLIAPNSVASAQVVNGSLRSVDLSAGARGDAFSRSVADSVDLRVPGGATVASLPIPQTGKYVIWAKMILSSSKATLVGCTLRGGGDVDTIRAYAVNAATVTGVLLADFKAAGTADLTCGGDATADFTKLTAIRVASLKSS